MSAPERVQHASPLRDSQTYNGLKDRFIATLGQEPEKELTCVMVPKDGKCVALQREISRRTPEVRFEQIV